MSTVIAPGAAHEVLDGRNDPGWRDFALAVVLAAFFFASAWNSLINIPLGEPPDEWAHLTYVHEIAVEGRLVPDYAGSQILTSRSSPNYLKHPPLYYSALGLAGRAFGWDPVRDYRVYRGISAAMAALGVLLWVLAGRAIGLAPLKLVVMVAALAAIPMFPFLAGSINNDNLAYLGVAMASLALTRLHQWPRAAYVLGAAGVVVTMLTKATAAVFLSMFLLAWAAGQWRHPGSVLRSRRFLAAMGSAAVLVAGYYAFTLAAYGSVLPVAGGLYEQKAPAEAVAIGPFALEFARSMLRRLPVIMSHDSLDPLGPVLGKVFWIMLAAPLAAWLLSRRGRATSPVAPVARAFLQALAVTLLVHLVIVWDGYNNTGVAAGMQPRYYSYALPGLFMFCFAVAGRGRIASGAFLIFSLSVALLVAAAPPKTARMQESARAAAQSIVDSPLRYAEGATAVVDAQMEVAPGRAGHLDTLAITGGTGTASGWAVDKADSSPARGVYVMIGTRLIGSAETGFARPDVARALGAPAAASAGFKFRIEGLPPGTDACDVRLAAEQSDGTLVLLPNSACPATSP